MDVSLDYISGKPTLQAAILNARGRMKQNQKVHNSEELGLESKRYVCSEMDIDNDPEGEITNAYSEQKTKKKIAEESYLTLDLNDEDDFDTWYEQLNSNLTKEPANATKERANLNDRNEKSKNISNNGQPGFEGVSNKLINLLKQPRFDLRQIVGRKNSAEQSFVPKNYYNNSNNNRQRNRWGPNNNRSARNNTPYQNKRCSNGHKGNGITSNATGNLCSNNYNGAYQHQNSVNPIVSQNPGCCSFHAVPAPINLCQSCDCNKNGFIRNGSNFGIDGINQASGLQSMCNAFGCNGAGAFNTSMALVPTYYGGSCCNFNCNDTNILKTSLNTRECCAGYSNAATNRNEHILNKNLNLGRGGNQTRCQRNTENNSIHLNETAGLGCTNQRSMNMNNINMGNPNNDNNTNTAERKNIASMLGITSQDLEINSVPAMLAMMQEILKNGVTINTFPKKHNQFDSNSEKRAE